MARRGRFALLGDILSVIQKKERISVSDLVSEARTSSAIIYGITEMLIKEGMVTIEKVNGREYYFIIAPEGKTVLRKIKNFQKSLPPSLNEFLGIRHKND